MKSETSVEIQDFIEKAEENSPKKLSMSLPVSLNFASPVVRYVLSCISKFDQLTALRFYCIGKIEEEKFSNFSYMVLNPNNCFQFEFHLF